MKKFLALFLVGMLLLGVVGCSSQTRANASQPAPDSVAQEPADTASPSLDVRGSITQITTDESGSAVEFFVEGVRTPDTTTDQAKVYITADTKIYKGSAEVPASELREGMTVEVKFTDEPRIMIYPPQANAAVIKIVE